MINIKRSKKVPETLKDERIKTYLKELADYEDKEEKKDVDKPKPPISYCSSDLLEAFDNDFFSKCYLTEEKFVNSWGLDVEHFKPQNEQPELIYEWTNLYPASHWANMKKPSQTPKGGYLDPCSPDDNVEEEIIYYISADGSKLTIEAKDENNTKAKNTAKLLDLLHNGRKKDKNSIKVAENLKTNIQKKSRLILNLIIEYQNEMNSELKRQKEIYLKEMLSKKSAFTMLCRSMPAVRYALNESFFD